MADDVRTGIRAAVVAYVVWGLLTIYWKALGDFDPFELIGWRIVFATAVLAVVVTVRGRWSVIAGALADRRILARLAVAAILLTANWTAYVWAVTEDRVIETALGYFMAPLATMILGVTVLHERASRLQLVAIGLAAASVVVLTISYGRPPVVALVIAGTWSAYALLKRQVPLTAVESLAGETFLLAIPAAVFVAAMSTRPDSIPATASAGDWVLVSLTGVVTAVPLLLFAVAAHRVPFTLLGALQYLVPTINLVLGWLVYGEPMPADRLVGFALVWAALLAITADRLSGSAPSEPVEEARLTPTPGG